MLSVVLEAYGHGWGRSVMGRSEVSRSGCEARRPYVLERTTYILRRFKEHFKAAQNEAVKLQGYPVSLP